jgi:hypothetical protein
MMRSAAKLSYQQAQDAIDGRTDDTTAPLLAPVDASDALFDGDGRLLATSSRKRLRAAGVSTVGDVEFDPALHALADRLGRVWSFRYAINFQVIRDDDGNDWLIELNPRLAGSALFSAFAGCDPIAATIALATGARWEPTRPRALRVWRHWSEWTQPEHRS